MQEISAQHFVGRVTGKAIIVRDGKVLITLGYTKNGNDIWDLPGGRMHHYETPEEATRREVMEELGIPIRLVRSVFMKQFLHAAGPTLLITYEAELETPGADFTLPTEEVDEIRWIDRDSLDSQKIFNVCREALDAFL